MKSPLTWGFIVFVWLLTVCCIGVYAPFPQNAILVFSIFGGTVATLVGCSIIYGGMD